MPDHRVELPRDPDEDELMQRVRLVGGCAWLGVAGYGISTATTESGDRAAWALPAWMTLLGPGLALFGVAGPGRVGRRDESGDYPAAGGIALLVVATITVAAIVT